MTVFIAVTCPDCHSTDIVKHGKSGEGKQRYCCRNEECIRPEMLNLATKLYIFTHTNPVNALFHQEKLIRLNQFI